MPTWIFLIKSSYFHAKGDRKGRPYLLAEIVEIYQGVLSIGFNQMLKSEASLTNGVCFGVEKVLPKAL